MVKLKWLVDKLGADKGTLLAKADLPSVDQTAKNYTDTKIAAIYSGSAANMLAAFDANKKIVSSGISKDNVITPYTIDYEKVTNGTITGEAWYNQATGEVTVRVNNTGNFTNGGDAKAITFTKSWAKPPYKTWFMEKASGTSDNQHMFINTSGEVYYNTTSTYIWAGAWTVSWNTNTAAKTGVFNLCKEYWADIPALASGNNGVSITLPIPNTESIIGFNYEWLGGTFSGVPNGVFTPDTSSIKWTNICQGTVAANTMRLRVRTVASPSAIKLVETNIPAIAQSALVDKALTIAKPYSGAKLIGSWIKYRATNWWPPSYYLQDNTDNVVAGFIGNAGGATAATALALVLVFI